MIGKTPWFVLAAFVVLACSMPPVLGGRINSALVRDGEYTGKYRDFPNSAEVRVVVEDGKIVACDVVDFGGVLKKTYAEDRIPDRIVDGQSTDVDAVSGATNFSRVIMNAAQKALDQALAEEDLLERDHHDHPEQEHEPDSVDGGVHLLVDPPA